MQRYIGFYTPRPFWVDQPVNFENIQDRTQFYNEMSEICYDRTTNNITLKICRDGLIFINCPTIKISTQEFQKIETTFEKWREYLQHANTLQLFLDSATIRCSNASYFHLAEITTRDAFVTSIDQFNKIGSMGSSGENYASILQQDRFSYGELEPKYNPRLVSRSTITSSVIDHALARYDRVASDAGLLRLISSLAKSLVEFKLGKYETSLILSWFLIEHHINALWENHLDAIQANMPDGRPRFSKERRKYLTKELTASMVIQHLELAQVLNWDDYTQIDATRAVRNRIVHRAKEGATLEEARSALLIAHKLIEEKENIDFDLNTSLTTMLL